MSDIQRLLDELEKEYPLVHETYNQLLSGGYTKEDVVSSYNGGGTFKEDVDKARGKYTEIIKEMGL